MIDIIEEIEEVRDNHGFANDSETRFSILCNLLIAFIKQSHGDRIEREDKEKTEQWMRS